MSPNLYLAALGPLSELFGVVLIIGVFALLRTQADRRPYFKQWELAWVFIAVSLVAGLIYERFVSPDSVFYPASPATTMIAAMLFVACRVAGTALILNGVQLLASGSKWTWAPKLAFVAGAAGTLLIDTRHVPLAPLALVCGPIVAIINVYAAITFAGLPRSRQSVGTRATTAVLVARAALGLSLFAFYLLQRVAPSVTANPWLVRFGRYGFYSDLILALLLAWAMVRLLIEDGRRESDDVRAHLRLVQDRDKLGDLYDPQVRLLGRRAFDALVGLDFARASFGSVAHVRISNYNKVASEHGPAVATSLLGHIAGVLDSAVRAHDRVYRWSPDELLVVMPRAIPGVARARVEFLAGRAASLTVAGVREPVRAELAVAVEFFKGGEDLASAAAAVMPA